MENYQEKYEYYPSAQEVDAWIQEIWQKAESSPYEAEILPANGFTHKLGLNYASAEFRYVKFTPAEGLPFYAYWQPAWSQPAPLLVHTPGYGAEMSTHPDLVMQGYNVIHINPLGFATPEGPNDSLLKNGVWPVMPDTIASGAEKGYKQWLTHCLHAIHWAQNQPSVQKDRVSFFGTSQGGGGSLLLGSIFQDRGVRCVAADVPYLTNFPLAESLGAYNLVERDFPQIENPKDGWRALGFIDTLSHARRLNIPVLLTAGKLDKITPAQTIESLFEQLPGTKSYSSLDNTGHRYTRQFQHLATAWFRMYA